MTELMLPALALGFLGSSHCLGMCGGLTVALNNSVAPDRVWRMTLTYQLSRVLSYAILGLLVGLLGSVIARWTAVTMLPIISGVLLIMMGFYLLSWVNLLQWLERQGHKLWARLRPLQSRFLPIRNTHQAVAVGMLWGLLPCGLVYSALALAAAAGSAEGGFLTMLGFGLGTLPAVMLAGLLGQRLVRFMQHKLLRGLLGVVFVLWGAYYLYFALGPAHSSHGHQHHHQHSFAVSSIKSGISTRQTADLALIDPDQYLSGSER